MGISVFSGLVSIELLDSVACAMLAAAATCRARNMGANILGALALGCVCGLCGPLLREMLIHGHAGTGMVMAALPDDALIGSLGGLAAIYMARQNPRKLFLWLDAISIGMACSLGGLMGLPSFGVTGALVIGILNGMSGGIIRDVCLGDIAMLAERKWYAASGLIACILGILIVMLPLLEGREPTTRLGEWGVIAGALGGGGLLIWKGGNED